MLTKSLGEAFIAALTTASASPAVPLFDSLLVDR